ncbi:MAG: glycosyl transferase [Rhodobacter sp. CACIA14H1]|nr:MAG: glycosyl transferase [Rhodobacter sp. CACIA14H1]
MRGQSYPYIEHIVQDGGSHDGTLAIIQKNASTSVFLESVRDGGIYDGINRGIRRARGDVIGLMHSDDIYQSEDTVAHIAALFADSSIDGVYGDLVYVDADEPSRIIRYWKSGAYDPGQLGRGWMPPHPTLYLRRSVFERHGLYDTEFRIAADYEAMLRYLVRGKIRLGYLPEVMVRMRVGGASNRSLGQILRKSREDYRAMRRHGVGGIGTLLSKNFGKVGQFIKKDIKTT